jgi:hypothetical protein
MSDLFEIFETDDPDQISDDLMAMVGEILSCHAYGEFERSKELEEELEGRLRVLAGAD